ncbi:hypothetical protein KIN20_037123 [Parelaphostrongylus tenuis]|uniref:Activin types I and II receptor domain-containing protein n=1 Tax=Parelaphostrongylus tenuis TaxID=148309 RepID=A0AAD5WLS0_PARTN|nr:hypothetical protein KIN20_037123 [Parelaphostrongylus tenuis]
MSISFALIFVMVMAPTCLAIECYTGLKIVAGQTVGTETIHCDNSNAYCYNMTANAAVLIDIVKAGCSLWRCMLARDRCISTMFQNVPISLCCCSTNRCNLGNNDGFRQLLFSGWNMEPSRQESDHVQQWSREEVAQKFHSAALDDDLPSTSLQGYKMDQNLGNAIIITDYFTNSHELHPTDSSEDISSNIPQKYGNEQKQEITSSITKSHTNSHKPHSSDSHGDLPSTTLRGNENSQKQESTNTMTAFHTNSHELHSTNSYGDTSSIISHRYGDEQKREKTNSITVLHTNSREPHSTDSDDNLSGTIHIP